MQLVRLLDTESFSSRSIELCSASTLRWALRTRSSELAWLPQSTGCADVALRGRGSGSALTLGRALRGATLVGFAGAGIGTIWIGCFSAGLVAIGLALRGGGVAVKWIWPFSSIHV